MKHFSIVLIVTLISLSVFSQTTSKPMKALLSEYEFQTHTTTLDDLEISYIKEGDAPKTLLFVHGLSSNADAWSKNIAVLKADYTCIALDLPGYGKSSIPDADYTPSYFAEILLQFTEKLELDNIILIGHSMGGQASVKFANAHPEIIDKLILVAPAGLEQFSEANAAMMKSFMTPASVQSTTDDQIENNYALNFYQQPEEVSKMISDRKNIKEASNFEAHCKAIVKSVYGMLNDPVHGELTSIAQPTLVIFGDKDMLIPNRYFNPTLTTEVVGQIALEHIQQATLKMIPEAGHFVQFEKPAEVNALIQHFVEQK
ncbi:alpha/beta fold hydrolase [Gelidibacter maritimus]|uniref:Alpha/beta hydrolase n=1 Tax=Gelidibacter maritimus TaxID=2761487 RepID=A0A7W2M8B1_9FLAO|nr:alpha/beta hydrolase [Gelidibacter maritimus]MBA6154493.1 alpha/beta hydrolase [Gelidibacter maritimus]